MRYARLALGTLFVMAASSLQAQTIGVTTVPNPNDISTNPDYILGYSFVVNSPITAVSLGVFDLDADGLNGSHEVGLWNSSGTLLASTTVASGTSETLDSSYRFHSITGVPLTVGATYYVGAANTDNNNDPWLENPLTLTTAPEITYDSRRFEIYNGTLVFPDLAGSGNTGYFGGNFQFTPTTAVPEPGSVALLAGMGISGSVFLRRRKNARQAA